MPPESLFPAGVATLTAIFAGGVAIAAHRQGHTLQWLVPVSGGLLVGVAAFGLLPEVALEIGWPPALLVAAAGFAVLLLLDRFASGYEEKLRGFIAPLVIATAVHAFIDGWGLATVAVAGPQFASSISLGIVLHKIPEGIALGSILRNATGRASAALFWVFTAESPTFLGGITGAWVTPADWVHYPLALAGGTFIFLGIHAIHENLENRGAGKTLIPAVAGGAGAALLQFGIRAWMK